MQIKLFYLFENSLCVHCWMKGGSDTLQSCAWKWIVKIQSSEETPFKEIHKIQWEKKKIKNCI